MRASGSGGPAPISWTSRSSSVASPSASRRASGSEMAAWASTGASGPSSFAGGNVAPTRAMSVATVVSPTNGTRPVTAS